MEAELGGESARGVDSDEQQRSHEQKNPSPSSLLANVQQSLCSPIELLAPKRRRIVVHLRLPLLGLLRLPHSFHLHRSRLLLPRSSFDPKSILVTVS